MRHLFTGRVCLALLLTGVFADTAVAQSRRERDVARNVQAGWGAYEDGLYEDAHRFFSQAERRVRDEEVAAEILSGLIRTDYHRGEYDEILRRLDEETVDAADAEMQASWRYWRARAYFSTQRYERAIEELTSMEEDLSDDLRGRRLRLFGQAYAQSDRHESAVRVFSEYDRFAVDEDEQAANLLDWVVSLSELDRMEEVASLLDRILAEAEETTVWSTALLWRSRILLDEQVFDRLQELLVPFAEGAERPSDAAAEAWYLLAKAAEQEGKSDEALEALIRGRRVAESSDLRQEGRLMEAQMLLQRGDWEEGVAALRDLLASGAMSDPMLSRIKLELGEAYLSEHRYDEALSIYQEYLEAFEEPEGRARALLGRAWSLLGLRRPLEAAASFEEAYELHPDLMERERALFKVADSYFDSGRYGQAREEYLLLTQVFPGSSLVPMALFQAAECLARQREIEAAAKEFRSIEDAFPNSVYAERSAKRAGGLQEEVGEWDRAIAAYNRLMTDYPDGELYPAALHRRGMIRYRLGLFADALEDFERLVAEFPDHHSMEQAFYMRGWCLYLLGENQQALDVCDDFLQRFPHSQWVPDVLFWLAAYQYNQGHFELAEDHFVELAEGAVPVELRASSLYWAGRSAMHQDEHMRAIGYFTQIARDYPRSELMPEVRFFQGEALTQLGQFSGAIVAFQEVIRRHPDHALVDRAWGRKGDSQFTLGADNPERFREAIASYQALLDGADPDAWTNMELQAEYKQSRAFEELGETDEALSGYLRIVYDTVGDGAVRDRDVSVWFTRAAFAAASIKEARGLQEEAIRILERVIEADVPAAPDAEHRIERMKSLQ